MTFEETRASNMSFGQSISGERLPPSPRSQARSRAYTLIELLVTIGIMMALIAITIPIVSHLHESSRQATDLSSLRQLTTACTIFAQDHDGLLPPGRVSFAPTGQDDYTWISYKNCWSPLVSMMPGLNSINSCLSVRENYSDADDFGSPESDYGAPDDTKVGWVYWGGRDDLYLGGTLQYRSLRRQAQHLTPGSQTLWTCWCWDSAGNGSASVCPHVKSRCVIYPNGVALKPPPTGLCVARDDGSASFVLWHDLIIIPQANGFKLYYQP